MVPSQWEYRQSISRPRDGNYGTSLVSHGIYYGGNIYIQLDIWTRKNQGYDYVWVKKYGKDLEHWWMPRSDKMEEYISSGYSSDNICYDYGYTWYRRSTNWIQVVGAKPNKPKGSLSFNADTRTPTIEATSTANRCTSVTYDYLWQSDKGKIEYIPGDGTSPNVYDYICKYLWNIDSTNKKYPYTTTSSTLNLSGSILPLDGRQHIVRYII